VEAPPKPAPAVAQAAPPTEIDALAEGSAQGAATPPATAEAPPKLSPRRTWASLSTRFSDVSECGFCQKGVHTGGSSAPSIAAAIGPAAAEEAAGGRPLLMEELVEDGTRHEAMGGAALAIAAGAAEVEDAGGLQQATHRPGCKAEKPFGCPVAKCRSDRITMRELGMHLNGTGGSGAKLDAGHVEWALRVGPAAYGLTLCLKGCGRWMKSAKKWHSNQCERAAKAYGGQTIRGGDGSC